MTKWEYKIVLIWHTNEETFNKLGLEGWDLVSANDKYAYFKRSLKECKVTSND